MSEISNAALLTWWALWRFHERSRLFENYRVLRKSPKKTRFAASFVDLMGKQVSTLTRAAAKEAKLCVFTQFG